MGGHCWLPILATFFIFFCNTMYSCKHTIKFRLFPIVTVGTGRDGTGRDGTGRDGTGASYVEGLNVIIMLVTFTMD